MLRTLVQSLLRIHKQACLRTDNGPHVQGRALRPGGVACIPFLFPLKKKRERERERARERKRSLDEERAIATLNQLCSGIKKQIVGTTAACEVWKSDDPRMRPSSESEDLSAEEETVSDPGARGSGEPVCVGREWGLDTSPFVWENGTAGNETNNSPTRLHGDGRRHTDHNTDQNANINWGELRDKMVSSFILIFPL